MRVGTRLEREGGEEGVSDERAISHAVWEKRVWSNSDQHETGAGGQVTHG